MKYLKYFENSAIIGEGVEVNLPNVSYLEDSNVLFVPGNEGTSTVKYNSTTGEIEADTNPDYSTMYLTFEAIESGTFSFTNDISYSLDEGETWTTLNANTNSPTVTAGNSIMWKGNFTPQGNESIGTFSATGNFNAYGNVMSLLYGDNFVGQTDLTGKDWAFALLFLENAQIINAQNLILPATTLASYCYSNMFFDCTSLTTAPALPATTLANSCYQEMFYSCTSLTTAPALSATTLVNSCYYYMFNGCTSLEEITCFATNITASNCIQNWVEGVSSTGTFKKNSAMSSWTTGVNGIPSGWTVVDA